MRLKKIQLVLKRILNIKIDIKKNQINIYNFTIREEVFNEDSISEITLFKDNEVVLSDINDDELYKYFMVYVSSNEGLGRFQHLFLKKNELHFKQFDYLKRIKENKHKDCTIEGLYSEIMLSNKSPIEIGEKLRVNPKLIKKLKGSERKNIISKILMNFMEINFEDYISLEEYQKNYYVDQNIIVYYKDEEIYKNNLYIMGNKMENFTGEGKTIDIALKNLIELIEEDDIILF